MEPRERKVLPEEEHVGGALHRRALEKPWGVRLESQLVGAGNMEGMTPGPSKEKEEGNTAAHRNATSGFLGWTGEP